MNRLGRQKHTLDGCGTKIPSFTKTTERRCEHRYYRVPRQGFEPRFLGSEPNGLPLADLGKLNPPYPSFAKRGKNTERGKKNPNWLGFNSLNQKKFLDKEYKSLLPSPYEREEKISRFQIAPNGDDAGKRSQ